MHPKIFETAKFLPFVLISCSIIVWPLGTSASDLKISLCADDFFVKYFYIDPFLLNSQEVKNLTAMRKNAVQRNYR